MGIEQIAASLASAAGTQGGERVIALGPNGGGGAVEAGRFAASLERAGGVPSVARTEMPAPFGNILRALDGIDVQARGVTDYAQSSLASGGQLTPGEIVQLTMKCQEFMFQCQLTSSIANRGADGVQQLFRQQG
jgi:hypothetical protein